MGCAIRHGLAIIAVAEIIIKNVNKENTMSVLDVLGYLVIGLLVTLVWHGLKRLGGWK